MIKEAADIPLGRRDAIALRLTDGRQVVASALAEEFAVSEDAIRRDLRALAAQGLCRRVYGGALPLSPPGAAMAVRMGEGRARKEALARRAAKLINPREFIFLDAGSTSLALAAHMPPDHDLTVATNSVDVAAALMPRRDVKLIVVGGLVNAFVGGAVDASAVLAVSRMNLDRVVLGACAVSSADGISAFELEDAIFKRALLDSARYSLVMATSEKLNARAPHHVAALAEIDALVVENDADIAVVASLEGFGAALFRADPPD